MGGGGGGGGNVGHKSLGFEGLGFKGLGLQGLTRFRVKGLGFSLGLRMQDSGTRIEVTVKNAAVKFLLGGWFMGRLAS